MSFDLDDTIAAIASAPGGAARGIVRLSGPAAIRCIAATFASDDGQPLEAVRRAAIVRGQFDVGGYCGPVPALAYLWPTKRSYTRQVSAELHLPGSPPVLQAALNRLVASGARIARPGEFTLRAFLAGRLDLTQAEAVLGVIDAESADQLQTALGQLAGGLATPLNRLRGDLLDLLAHLEAGLDFVEEDIEFISQADLIAQLGAASQQVASIAQQMQTRAESGDRPRVVLVGLPNAGKSSLFNALAGESAAIVSSIAGTTRDYVTKVIECEGIECLLVDTAGLETAELPPSIESAAQTQSAEQSRRADVILRCLDATDLQPAAGLPVAKNAEERTIVVLTKIDQADSPASDQETAQLKSPVMRTSSRTGVGLDELRRAIAGCVEQARGESSVVAGTAARCRESLLLASQSLDRALEAAAAAAGEELVAAEVRTALDDLGRVVGAIYTDDVLDRIFSRFCIGK